MKTIELTELELVYLIRLLEKEKREKDLPRGAFEDIHQLRLKFGEYKNSYYENN